MDRLFRGIGNRIRGEQAAEAAATRGTSAQQDNDSAGIDTTEESAESETASDPPVNQDMPPVDDSQTDSGEPGDDAGDDEPDIEGSGSGGDDVLSQDGDDTLTFTDGGSQEISVSDDAGWSFTITDGGDDGSIIIGGSADVAAGSADSQEPEPELVMYPEPVPEPEPEPDDSAQVGVPDFTDTFVPDDDTLPVGGDRPNVRYPVDEAGSGSAGSISAAEAIRRGLISRDDLRAQPTLEGRVDLSDLLAGSDDDDDDAIPPRLDDRIEVPKIENVPEPGSGPPNPQPNEPSRLVGDEIAWLRDGVTLDPGPSVQPREGLQPARSTDDSRLIRDGSENLGSTLPPAAGGATYSALNATGDADDEDEDSGPGDTATGSGYWSLVNGEAVWVPGPDGGGPSGDPPKWPNQDDSDENIPVGGYFLLPSDDPDAEGVWFPGPSGSTPNGDGGYWSYFDGQMVWVVGADGEGPPGDPPEHSIPQPAPTVPEESSADETFGGTHEGDPPELPPAEADEEDEESAQPVFEPLPTYTIGDPVSSGGQPSGFSPADLRVGGGPDIAQYIDTDLIQQRLANASSDSDVLADDEIERPSVRPERAPGEDPPRVASGDPDIGPPTMEAVIQRDVGFQPVDQGSLEGTAPDTADVAGTGELAGTAPDTANVVGKGGLAGTAPDTADAVQRGVPILEQGLAQQPEGLKGDLTFTVPDSPSAVRVDSTTMAGDSEADQPSKVNPNVMAGDSEADQPSKVDPGAMAGDSEAGEPSKTIEVVEARPDATLEVVNLDAPIDFQTTPLTGQPPSIAQVETAIPVAIDPQPAIANVELSVPVEPLVASDAVVEPVPPETSFPTDDDDDPLDGM